jgi:hypothetical protein
MEVRGCFARLQYITLFKISNFYCPTPLEHFSECASSSLSGLGVGSKMACGVFVNRPLQCCKKSYLTLIRFAGRCCYTFMGWEPEAQQRDTR